jgi:hypothetical protein
MPSLENIANSIHEWLNNQFAAPWPMLIEFVIVGVCIISLFALLGFGADHDGKKSFCMDAIKTWS